MNILINVFLIWLGSAIAQECKDPNPITNQTIIIRDIHSNWKAADCCIKSSGVDEKLLTEPQKCKLPKDDKKLKEFQYCYLEKYMMEGKFICLDTGKVMKLSSKQERDVMTECGLKYAISCCMAPKEDRPKKCQPLIDCYYNCLLLCKDCPIKNNGAFEF